MCTQPIVKIECSSGDPIKDAVAQIETQLQSLGLPSYNNALRALAQIARLGREGTRDGHIIRDGLVEIAEKALV